jgi:hypothetical protein
VLFWTINTGILDPSLDFGLYIFYQFYYDFTEVYVHTASVSYFFSPEGYGWGRIWQNGGIGKESNF